MRSGLGLSIFVSLLLAVALAAPAAATPLIKQSVDESILVTLSGNTRPEMTAANDRGPVSDSLQLQHIYMQLRRSAAQEAAAAALIEQLHDRNSPQYHHWLTADEVAQRFGPDPDDVATVTTWLRSSGFTVHNVYMANGVIDFSGNAGSIRNAFHTEIHNLVVGGKAHIANASDPRIPAALAPAVLGIVALNDFRPHPALVRKVPKVSFDTGNSDWPQTLVPGDLQTIYNISPLYLRGITGLGQTIVVVEDTDLYAASDWTQFRHTFGLDRQFPQGSLTQSHPQPSQNPGNGGACADPGVNPDDFEAIIDTEWASATAPNAAIVLISCADTNVNFGGYIAMQNLLTGRSARPSVISVSYGESESYDGSAFNAYINQLYELAVFQGVSVFVAAGDWGADVSDAGGTAMSGINVSGFASTPNNVAVGGTDFLDTATGTTATYWAPTNNANYSSALSYIPEMPWNDTCASQVTARYLGFTNTYGPSGSCSVYFNVFPNLVAGSGGPSGCALGNSLESTPGVVDGSCRGYSKPSYQVGIYGNPRDGVRDVPDVTLFASNGWWGHYYVVCFTDTSNDGTPSCSGPPTPTNWSGGGGTSFASPIMAGIQALVDQTAGLQGNPNYVLYALAAEEYGSRGSASCNSSLGNRVGSSCVFHDVTQGDMNVPCVQYAPNGTPVGSYDCYYGGATYTTADGVHAPLGVLSTSTHSYQPAYTAGHGYDYASGLGSVNADNLVRSWPGGQGGQY
jgi:subtilase family serine protease